MTRGVALPVAIVAMAMLARAADPSPQSKPDEPEAFDIEPPILKQHLSDEPLPATGTPEAEVAAAKRERAELEAAEANLRRQQKLLKLGSADKSDVVRAQERLAELKAPKN